MRPSPSTGSRRRTTVLPCIAHFATAGGADHGHYPMAPERIQAVLEMEIEARPTRATAHRTFKRRSETPSPGRQRPVPRLPGGNGNLIGSTCLSSSQRQEPLAAKTHSPWCGERVSRRSIRRRDHQAPMHCDSDGMPTPTRALPQPLAPSNSLPQSKASLIRTRTKRAEPCATRIENRQSSLRRWPDRRTSNAASRGAGPQ